MANVKSTNPETRRKIRKAPDRSVADLAAGKARSDLGATDIKGALTPKHGYSELGNGCFRRYCPRPRY